VRVPSADPHACTTWWVSTLLVLIRRGGPANRLQVGVYTALVQSSVSNLSLRVQSIPFVRYAATLWHAARTADAPLSVTGIADRDTRPMQHAAPMY
jgi:hypothetical protein